ncbi:hypothetical protein GGI12_001831 [Dipsacomyces acuminosporus]|nr:hypothetical protein GGI12_001831 [Dipsacomyces acuminosporus]
MVKFTSVLVLTAATLLGSLVSGAPAPVNMLARRDYAEVNPSYKQANNNNNNNNNKVVTVTVTQFVPLYGGNHYSATPAAPAPSPVYTSSPPPPTYSDWHQQMLQQVNAVRAKAGKPPVKLDDRLSKLAQEHSNYQSSIKSMTHADSAGSLGQRCSQAGIEWSGVAENVAWNYPDVSAVVKGWVESSGHYKNMVGDYNIVGFGETNKYWTQSFAKA